MDVVTDAVVLAGVHDWGGCALNQAAARPLALVANRPLIEYSVRALRDIGVRRAVICANGQSAEIRALLGDGAAYGIELQYYDDPMPRGPAGCARDALQLLPGAANCLVIEASIVPYFDLFGLVRAHEGSGAALTVAACSRGGDEDQYTPAGVYVCSAAALKAVPDKGFADIKERLIPTLHADGQRVDIHVIDGLAPRISGVGSYLAVNEWALKKAHHGAWHLDGYAAETSPAGTALVHGDARVSSTARLLGPVLIGPGAVVRAGAIIVGPTSIGRDSIVGENAVVSRSAVWDNAVVADGARLDRCVVASGVRVQNDENLFHAVCVQSERFRLLQAVPSNTKTASSGHAKRNSLDGSGARSVDGNGDEMQTTPLWRRAWVSTARKRNRRSRMRRAG